MTERALFVVRTVNAVVERSVYRLPVDVMRICRSYGIRLLPAGTYIAQGVDAPALFAAWGNSDGIASSRGRDHVISYNERAPEKRLRFTLAEELMHILLGHTADPRFNALAQSYPDELYRQYEHEARYAAGMLLLPPSVYFCHRPFYAPDQLARLCRVSDACACRAARLYDRDEAFLRAHFTKKTILCDTSSLIRRSFRPLDVSPAEDWIL